MDNYIAKRLTGLHESGSSVSFKRRFIVLSCGFAVVLLLPTLHIAGYYYVWAADKAAINTASCTCDCFDTVLRGRYEWPPSSYKHMYFNATRQTVGMWAVVVLGVLLSYECVRYLSALLYTRSLHRSWLIVFLSSIYPHYYGWWNFINYYNEDFYSQWYHQLYFTVTELLSSLMVLHLCNRQSTVEPWKLLFVFTINLMHIMIGGHDQFVQNLLYRGSQAFEAVRDVGLLIPDLLHVFVCYFETRILADNRGTKIRNLFYREELMLSVVVLVLFSLLGKNL